MGGSNKNDKIKFEDILKLVGDDGRWQIMVFLVLWLEGILIGCYHLSSTFLGASVDHWCNTSHIEAVESLGWTLDQKKQYAIPFNEETGKYEACEMYDLSDIRITTNFDVAMKQRPKDLNTIHCEIPSVPEEEYYEFDTTEGIRSIVTDWHLVCERLPLLSTVQGSYMGGVFVGCLVWGWASDKFGRKISIMVACCIQIVSSILVAFSVDYIMFVFLRFLVAFSVSGVFECGFVLVTEICGAKYRTYFGILTQFPFGLGASLLPMIAYFVRDWVNLQLAIGIPSALLLSYYWLIPESPRWLMSEGRFDEALKILKDGAKKNRRTLPSDVEMKEMMEKFREEEEIVHQSEAAATWQEKVYEVFKEIIQLVATPEMRKRTLNVFFSWLIVAMVYYGLSFNSKNLGADRYLSVFISGFVEVPAVVAIIPALAKFGRMKCYCGTFILGGLCCGIVAIITFCVGPGEIVWLPVTFAMIGKFLISGTFAIAYLYTAELFPTPVRNVAVGMASTFARIGSMSAPYIVDLLGSIHPGIPVIIFGIVSVVAGLLSLMLPETLNKKMPETVAEVERWAKLKKHSPETGDASEMNALQPNDESAAKRESS